MDTGFGLMELVAVGVTIGLAIFGWVMARLRHIDARLQETPTRMEMQQAIEATSRPIREDIRELKTIGMTTHDTLLKYIITARSPDNKL